MPSFACSGLSAEGSARTSAKNAGLDIGPNDRGERMRVRRLVSASCEREEWKRETRRLWLTRRSSVEGVRADRAPPVMGKSEARKAMRALAGMAKDGRIGGEEGWSWHRTWRGRMGDGSKAKCGGGFNFTKSTHGLEATRGGYRPRRRQGEIAYQC